MWERVLMHREVKWKEEKRRGGKRNKKEEKERKNKDMGINGDTIPYYMHTQKS